jgi:hypothetical protein
MYTKVHLSMFFSVLHRKQCFTLQLHQLPARAMRPKARGLAQHGGSPSWLEENDPAGVILYVMDGPYLLFL